MKFKVKDGVLVRCTGDEEDVTIPEGVTTIGREACSQLFNMKSVFLPDSVKKICESAFSECQKLKTIRIPSGITSIGNSAFYWCGLESLTIPDGIENIARGTFMKCGSLSSVTIPDSVKTIEASAFAGCKALRQITIPSSVRSIGKSAFSTGGDFSCGLESITIPDGIETIEEGTFYGCWLLSSVTIPDSVQTIEADAFAGCKALRQITIPSSVRSIGKSAFSTGGYSSCGLESITIPDGIENIAQETFRKCVSLSSVTIPDSVRTIEAGAFAGCVALRQITIPSNVRSIGVRAFADCDNLESIAIPDSVKTIEEGTFEKCGDLRQIIIPSSVRNIGERAFAGCKNLSDITIPGGVVKIEKETFRGCENLVSITIPDRVQTIGARAFEGCTALQQVVLPAGVKIIGDYAFAGCTNLSEVSMPDKPISYGAGVFRHCSRLTDQAGFLIRNGIMFSYSGKNSSLVIPDGVTTINADAFEEICPCQLKLPNSLRQFERNELNSRPAPVVNLPEGYLQQSGKIDVKMSITLLEGPWKNLVTDKDWVALYLFQSNKALLAMCEPLVAKNPNNTLALMSDMLTEECKPSHFQRAAEFYFENKTNVSQEQVDRLYKAAFDAKIAEVVELLAPYASGSVDTTAPSGGEKARKGASAEPENPIEAFCAKNFVPFVLDKVLNNAGIKDSALSNVKYRGSEKFAPAFVVKCAIVPYMQQLKERPKVIGNYTKDYSLFEFIQDADNVAAELDMESFRMALDTCLGKALPYPLGLLVPYGRFASGKQIVSLNARSKEWEKWDDYGATGRSAIIVTHGAILLNDSRESLLVADKLGLLGAAARLRHVSEETLRNTAMENFDFDSDGKKRYNLGNTILEVSMNADLTLSVFDTKQGKNVKTLPAKGSDPDKYEAATADLADLKANIKNVVKNRVASLRKDFLSGKSCSASSWKTVYSGNPVLRMIAELIVWRCEPKQGMGFGFILNASGQMIDADMQIITIPDTGRVSVAHPLDMDVVELAKWREYLKKQAIAQPFTQMFETVYSIDLQAAVKRYAGIELPFFLIKHLEKDGFEVEGEYQSQYKLRIKYNASLNLEIDTTGVYSAKYIPMKDTVKLGEFNANGRIDRTINHALYMLDGICLESAVRTNNMDVLMKQTDKLTEKNILRMIDAANDTQSTDCLAWLMDFKNTHFRDAVDDLEL